MSTKRPTFHCERALIAQGFRMIVGVDEVGSGALAGPVLAGAVVLPLDSRLGMIADSKLLTAAVRETLFDQISNRSKAWAIGSASVQEIYDLGIRPATLLAMARAVEQIHLADYVLVDAWTIPGISMQQKGIIRGDLTVKSIAAASIMAKVTRDRLMSQLAIEYPMYGFESHKGYGTRAHQQAILKHGPCAMHRLNYRLFHQISQGS